jgi:hypothetical protein
MPAQRKRAGKRARAQRTAGARVRDLAFAMEEPLNEAIDAAHALRFMGYGLSQLAAEDEGRAIAAVAWTACQRLAALQETWRSLCKAAVRAKNA